MVHCMYWGLLDHFHMGRSFFNWYWMIYITDLFWSNLPICFLYICKHEYWLFCCTFIVFLIQTLLFLCLLLFAPKLPDSKDLKLTSIKYRSERRHSSCSSFYLLAIVLFQTSYCAPWSYQVTPVWGDYVLSSFPPRPLPPPQKLFPLTSKPFELNLWYLAQTIYGSGEMYWMTFPWPWPKVMAVALISKNLLVCTIKWEPLIPSLQNVAALLP